MPIHIASRKDKEILLLENQDLWPTCEMKRIIKNEALGPWKPLIQKARAKNLYASTTIDRDLANALRRIINALEKNRLSREA